MVIIRAFIYICKCSFEPTFMYKTHCIYCFRSLFMVIIVVLIDVRCGTENATLFLYIVSIIIATADERHKHMKGDNKYIQPQVFGALFCCFENQAGMTFSFFI